MEPVLSRLLGRVVEVFERALANSPDAQRRLALWGITNFALHRLGLVDGSLAELAKGPAREELQRVGLLDRFSGALAFPALDEAGEVVQIAFLNEERAISWLFDEAPSWFNRSALKHSREVRIVHDPIEAITKDAIAPAGPPGKLTRAAREMIRISGVTYRIPIDLAGELNLDPVERVRRHADGFTLSGPKGMTLEVQGIGQESPRHLRAFVRVMRGEAATPVHLDSFDLYDAKRRSAFSKNAACLLGEEPALLENLLAESVTAAETWLRERTTTTPAVTVTGREREEALSLLRDPKLLDRVLADLGTLGMVGEETNKLVAFVASISRRLADPLSVMVVSRSGAGKSTLAEAAALLCPPEEVHRFTRLTPQTLYYQKPDALAHKLIVVEEDKGVEEAAYALRALQSARKLSLSTAAGQGESKRREVKGPVSLFVTTTRTDIDEETASRFLVLTTDESSEQTRRILEAQRAADAKVPAEREALLRLHQNAQRLLEPLDVVNPWAPQLTFPHTRLSARRDQKKYLGLIRAVAFLHQHQRTVENKSVIAQLDDIRIANRLASDALGQSLFDLSPPSRRLLVEIRTWLLDRAAKEGTLLAELRFRRRDLRERTGWRRTQIQEHLQELLETEYLQRHGAAGRGHSPTFSLDWDGEGLDGGRFLKGLLDPDTLKLPPSCRPVAANKERAPIRPPGAAKVAFDASKPYSRKTRP